MAIPMHIDWYRTITEKEHILERNWNKILEPETKINKRKRAVKSNRQVSKMDVTGDENDAKNSSTKIIITPEEMEIDKTNLAEGKSSYS